MSIAEKNPQIGHVLGIDYGKSNVGLALADSETRMAFAHEKLENNKDLTENLAKIINQENITRVIIGIPSYVTEGEVESEAKKLGEWLRNRLKVEVFYQNEMFTTKTAQVNLKERGARSLKKYDDAESARIILQEWLDNN